MKLKILFIAIGAVFLSALAGTALYSGQLKAERDKYRSNATALLAEVERYEADFRGVALQVASVHALELKLSEMEKYRADDMRLIEALKVDKKRLESVATAHTQTITRLRNIPVSIDSGQLTVDSEKTNADNSQLSTLNSQFFRCFEAHDPWYDLSGCISPDNTFNGDLTTRDSLVYVEHIVPHKFLFIKWGCRERRQEIVSRNPNTVILAAEFVTFKNRT